MSDVPHAILICCPMGCPHPKAWVPIERSCSECRCGVWVSPASQDNAYRLKAEIVCHDCATRLGWLRLDNLTMPSEAQLAEMTPEGRARVIAACMRAKRLRGP